MSSYLSAAITWKGVVPQALVRTFNWLLVVVVAMGSYSSCKSSNCCVKLEHFCGRGVADFSGVKEQQEKVRGERKQETGTSI